MKNANILLQPVVSEKSFEASDRGIYTFRVARTANKTEIKKEIEKRFNVKVEKVNVINRKGKRTTDWKTRVTNRRKDYKKAFVTLKKGDSIDIFKQ